MEFGQFRYFPIAIGHQYWSLLSNVSIIKQTNAYITVQEKPKNSAHVLLFDMSTDLQLFASK